MIRSSISLIAFLTLGSCQDEAEVRQNDPELISNEALSEFSADAQKHEITISGMT